MIDTCNAVIHYTYTVYLELDALKGRDASRMLLSTVSIHFWKVLRCSNFFNTLDFIRFTERAVDHS